MVVYISKGSATGGEVGGTLKASGTWTQPLHNHDITATGSHQHTTLSHTLTVNEIPSHTHRPMNGTGGDQTNTINSGTGFSGQNTATTWQSANNLIENTGGGLSHSHGNTGSAGVHDHNGATGLNTTINTWRPRGLNYTRQQRI